MKIACRCCGKTVAHRIEWAVEGEQASVKSTCSACGAVGTALIDRELYRPPHSARIPDECRMVMLDAVSRALRHAEVGK